MGAFSKHIFLQIMASTWTLIILLAFIKCACSLSNPFSKRTLSLAQKMEGISELQYICPKKCACYVFESNLTVSCESKELIQFPTNLHASVNDLNLAKNKIGNLFYNISLKALNVLNVNTNNIEEIDKKWISSLVNLRTLDLSSNSLHSNTIENTFKKSILYLNLSNNKISEINGIMFHEVNTLLSLDLSNNKIENISYNSFWNQNNLRVLNLSSNKLADLQYEWFQNLHSLTTLILKENKLILLRNVVFSPLNQLKVLDLSKNYIKSIGLLSFKGLVNLQFLNISSNNISHFQDGVFRFLDSLHTIDISQNSFISIDNLFVYTIKLQFLYMNDLSKFKVLSASSLSGLQKLVFLDLSGSGAFSEVHIKAFYNTKNLKTINFSNTNLTNLRMGVFSYLEKIEAVKLKGNPWKCDCYMYWLLIWLGEHTNTHLLSPSETFCSTPPNLKGHVLLDALDHNMVCTNASINHYTHKTRFKVGAPAFLECQVEGNPLPSLVWITPQKTAFHWAGGENHTEFKSNSEFMNVPQIYIHDSEVDKKDRFYVTSNGNLAIRNVERGDGGFYMCIATNPLNSDTVAIRLTLDYEYLVHIKIISVLVGMATSFGFLLLTLISVLIKMILKHFGVKLPCRSGNASPRTQQIKKILESMEHYKRQQLDRLKDNYNVQVQRIKDNCMQQMERLRESYSSQAERLRDIKEYGTLQIDRIRENYYSQVQRVRDYSASQIIRLRENYIYQRNRIRKFSAHHLYKLRENYKLQQQHLNKILENLNIESCRNVCNRTDSVVFEPEITLENVLVPKICLQTFVKETCDSNDNSSQLSAYFTPDETGSEISGHESDERESFETASKLGAFLTTDTVVRMEDKTDSAITNIPDYNSVKDSAQTDTSCNQKSANETLV